MRSLERKSDCDEIKECFAKFCKKKKKKKEEKVISERGNITRAVQKSGINVLALLK